MKESIDKIVKTTAKQESMPHGHEERFLTKLKQKQKEEEAPKPKHSRMPKRKVLTIIMRTAAAILVMFTFLKPSDILQSEIECDEVCEFINYSDNSIYSLQSDLISTAEAKLLPEELLELKEDLILMIEDYNMSKEQQNVMSEEDFLGFMYNVYKQQVESITYISALIK